MNHFYHSEIENSPHHLEIDINDVTSQTMGSLHRKGIVLITVNDDEFNDTYSVKIEKSNLLGVSGICWLNRQPSYQAQFDQASTKPLKEVINAIAGGEILSCLSGGKNDQ